MDFAREYGLPVAIKAAFGGGGRGLKVARTMDEIGEQYESAVREATAAFGNGECFAERYLDRPRHVETQCLADAHGNVVVVSTRDCSLQRRHQKLVEEAPAPFLSDAQHQAALRRVEGDPARGGLRRRGHLRVPRRHRRHDQLPRGEHQAPGRAPGLRGGHRPRPGPGDVPHRRRASRSATTTRVLRGHSIEFRINAEDPARNFLPAPGTITEWNPPSGPGVRLDAGYGAGQTVPQAFDSLIGKLIVTGRVPYAGAGALPPRARRVHRRRHAHRAAVPPGRCRRPGVRRRPPRRAHPLDRDRVRRGARTAADRGAAPTHPPASG